MFILSWIGISIFTGACLLDMFVYDNVTEKTKPAVYLIGAALFLGGLLL